MRPKTKAQSAKRAKRRQGVKRCFSPPLIWQIRGELIGKEDDKEGYMGGSGVAVCIIVLRRFPSSERQVSCALITFIIQPSIIS